MLVDGGDNQFFARYLAGRFRNTSRESEGNRLILVTHGDADHFVGLPKIQESEKNEKPRKRLFIQPKRFTTTGSSNDPAKRELGKSVPDVGLLAHPKSRERDVY